MGLLSGAMAGAAKLCQQVHGEDAAITVTRVGGTPTPTAATVYREKSHWRRSAGGQREQCWTRKAVLAPDVAAVPVGSVFTALGTLYTVEQVALSQANGTQTLHGTRLAASTVSRDSYHRR